MDVNLCPEHRYCLTFAADDGDVGHCAVTADTWYGAWLVKAAEEM